MKSSRFIIQVLLAATGAIARGGFFTTSGDLSQDLTSTSATGIPEFSLSTVGITLLASSNSSQFTNLTGQWQYPEGIENSGFGGVSLQWFTQFVAVDLFPVPFDADDGFPNLPLPPACSNFLQVGHNITGTFPIPDSNEDSSFLAFAFYTWNNITTNITDANGNLVEFVPGETVTITILPSDNGANATVLYDSSVLGLIEISLTGGSLCQSSVEWAFGSPVDALPLAYDVVNFSNSRATEVDVSTGDVSVLGPDSGDRTLLITLLGGEQIIADCENENDQGFDIPYESDCPDY